MLRRFPVRASALLIAGFLLASWAHAQPQPLKFQITFSPEVSKDPFTGRVLVMLGSGGEPRFGPNWFRPQPFFAMDVTGWKPGETLEFVDQFAFPKPLKDLPDGTYAVQAVMDFGNARDLGSAPGNGFSKAAKLELRQQSSGTVRLDITEAVKESPFRERERLKLFEIESKLLSDFHKRPVKLRASVALPVSFGKDPN